MRKGMTGPRWLALDGWVKMAQNVNGVKVLRPCGHSSESPTVGT
uniref:Uncharacterized protein n=1 Tax=Ralstonia solanacearum TaxID=305 RepID=A0A0S4TZS8_RALSL|nr:protein of unknown function [Ralstonia solanacearum]